MRGCKLILETNAQPLSNDADTARTAGAAPVAPPLAAAVEPWPPPTCCSPFGSIPASTSLPLLRAGPGVLGPRAKTYMEVPTYIHKLIYIFIYSDKYIPFNIRCDKIIYI
jgi:hypothetical protein